MPYERYSNTFEKRHSLVSLSGSFLLVSLFISFFLETYFLTDFVETVPSFWYLVLGGSSIGLFVIWLFYKQPYSSCYPLTTVGMCGVIVGILLGFPLTISFSLGVTLFMSMIGISHTLEIS
jgi:hypothetical protein